MLEVLCKALLSNNKRLVAIQSSILSHCSDILARLKDQESTRSKLESRISANSNGIQSIATRRACKEDLIKLYISFSCLELANSFKKSTNIINDSLQLPSRLEVDTFRLGLLPIRSAYIFHIKVKNSPEPTFFSA